MTDILTIPFSEESEYTVLCAVLMEDYTADEMLLKLDEEDFFIEDNRYIFNAIKMLVATKKVVNVPSLMQFLKDRINKKEIPENTLRTIFRHVGVFHSNIINILKEKSSRRKLLRLSNEIQSMVTNPDNDSDFIISNISQSISHIDNTKNDVKVHDANELLKERWYELEENAQNGTFKHGLYCGISTIDQMTEGFKDGEYIVIGARPSMGKSAFMMNCAVNMAIQNKDNPPSLVFSIEMRKKALIDRMFSADNMLDQNIIKYGNVNDSHLISYSKTIDAIGAGRIFITDKPSVSVAQIKSTIRKYQKLHGVGIVFIDYMAKIKYANQRDDEYNGITQVSADLKECARELNIPIVCLAQLNRNCEDRTNKRPIMSDIKSSGSIEADADFIGFLFRPAYYGEDELKRNKYDVNDVTAAELVIAKNRCGQTGIATMNWHSEYSLFTSREYHGNK